MHYQGVQHPLVQSKPFALPAQGHIQSNVNQEDLIQRVVGQVLAYQQPQGQGMCGPQYPQHPPGLVHPSWNMPSMDVDDDSSSHLLTTRASSYPPSVASNQAATSQREDTRTSGNQDQMAPAHRHSPECQTKGGKATSVSKLLQYGARDKGKQRQKEEEVERPTAPTDKGKGKAKEIVTSSSEDEQVVVLLQCMYNAGVPEHVTAAVLSEPLVQLAVAHLLDELELAHCQCDDARSHLFQFASSSWKREASPPTTLPQPKKACLTEPTEVVGSTSQEGVSHVREQPLPYKEVVAPTAEPMQVNVSTHQEQDSAFLDTDPVDEPAKKKKNWKSKVEVPSATVPVHFEANVPHSSDEEAQVVPHNNNPPPPAVPVASTSRNVVPGEGNESDYGSDFMKTIYNDDTVKEQRRKEAANKAKAVKLEKAAKDKEKALMRLEESRPGPIPVGCNNFNRILSPYFYLSYQTNTVYVRLRALEAREFESHGQAHTAPHSVNAYHYAPRGFPMNTDEVLLANQIPVSWVASLTWTCSVGSTTIVSVNCPTHMDRERFRVLYHVMASGKMEPFRDMGWVPYRTWPEDKYRCLEAQLDHPGSPPDRVETRVAVAPVDPTQVPLPASPSPISATALGSPMEQVIPSGTEEFFDPEAESTNNLGQSSSSATNIAGAAPSANTDKGRLTDWSEEVQQADPDAVGKMPMGSLPPTP
ncbi:hypothetical protein DXG01_004548 [Tephrocybe rancida]|nr:hypothetical protein DXG01_004548 [Tephrocybe rancida]